MMQQNATEEREHMLQWFRGNMAAVQCVETFGRISQLADDIADGDAPDVPEAIEKLLLLALVDLPRNDFYRAHATMYAPLLAPVVINWGRSNEWARSTAIEDRMFAYVLRESGEQLITATAYAVGGPDHARAVARDVHQYYHVKHREPFIEWDRDNG